MSEPAVTVNGMSLEISDARAEPFAYVANSNPFILGPNTFSMIDTATSTTLTPRLDLGIQLASGVWMAGSSPPPRLFSSKSFFQ